MGFRYRKTKTFKNGVKVSAGKKSAGVSFGGRRAGVSFNTKRGVHVRASIPGTGVSYVGRVGGGRRKRKKKEPGRVASLLTAVLFVCLVSWAVPILIPVFILGIVGIAVWAYRSAKKEQAAASDLDVEAPVGSSVSVVCPGCSERFTVMYSPDAVRDGALSFACPKCKTKSDVPIVR